MRRLKLLILIHLTGLAGFFFYQTSFFMRTCTPVARTLVPVGLLSKYPGSCGFVSVFIVVEGG